MNNLTSRPRFSDDSETVDSGNGTPPIVDIGVYEYEYEYEYNPFRVKYGGSGTIADPP